MRNERVHPAEIGSLSAAVGLFQPLLSHLDHEQMGIAYLDAANLLLDVVTHPAGTDRHVAISPRALVHEALSLDARSLILAHNHPSGDPAASDADRKATRRLVEVCRGVGLRVHDHLIIARNRVTSFRAEGLM